MGNHSHSHDGGHNHGNISGSKIASAFAINLAFTVIELIGGLWTNSMAIISDAVHDLGDSIAIGLGWYLNKKSGKGKTPVFTFGYKRFSLLGALVNGLILLTGSLFILSEAIPRLFAPEPVKGEGMLILSIIGIAANGFAVYKLSGGKSLNEKVISLHLLEDVLGWAAVLVVSIVLLFADYYILDPILSVIITLYILFNVMRNLRKTLMIFLQSAPENVSIEKIEQDILKIKHIKNIHDIHIWTQDGETHVLTVHVVLEGVNKLRDIIETKDKIKDICRKYSIDHATIETELEEEECYMKDNEE